MDPLIEALRRLVHASPAHPTGHPKRRQYVAERAGVSADNLYQICKAVKLRSGRPRMLGRDVRERLDAAFPGWSDDISPKGVTEPCPAYSAAPSLAVALPVVLDAIVSLPPVRWASVRAQLDMLAAHPELRAEVLYELDLLFAAGAVKRPTQDHDQPSASGDHK